MVSKIFCAIALATFLGITGLASSNANERINGSGKTAKESRKLAPFHAIELNLPSSLNVTQAAAAPMILEGDDNILPAIKTEVKDGVLVITSDKDINTKTSLSFTVKTPKLDQLTVKGTSTNKVSALAGPKFTVVSKGTSNIDLEGTVKQFNVEIDGTGTLQAAKLSTKETQLMLKGTGTAKVNASDKLDVTIKGTGTVKYSGSPKVTQNILGIGTVTKL